MTDLLKSSAVVVADASRSRELDGLRGVAILMVILYHLAPGTLFWLWSGVDLFMVLSGFLITRIVLQSRARGSWSLRNFWMRRVLRIWPLYFLALIGVIAVLLWQESQTPGTLAQTRGIIPSLFFLQLSDAYFVADPAIVNRYIPHFLHSWSVAAEEQFYVIWPLLVMLVAGRRRLAVAVCLGLVAMALFLRTQGFIYMLLLSRCDGLALGAMLAFVLVRNPGELEDPAITRRRARWLIALLAAVGLPLAWYFVGMGYWAYYTGTPAPDHMAKLWAASVSAFAFSWAAWTAAVLTGTLPWLSAPLRFAPLVQLGRYSYAIYLAHIPVQAALRPVWPETQDLPALLRMLAYIGLLFLIGYLCRRLIENPAEHLKRRFPL